MNYQWLDIKNPLLQWYRKEHRDLKWRQTKNPYHIWVSEIMLQQTRVEAVKGYYPDAKILEYEVGRRSYEVKLSNRIELKFNTRFNVIEIDN